MKYKNIIFDFGNVLGTFDPEYILKQFCDSPEDFSLLYPVVYENWQVLDEGSADYETCVKIALDCVPDRLKPNVTQFFKEWHLHLPLLSQTIEFVKELIASDVPVYLLSNASAYFADHAYEVCPILKQFDGILFSGPAGCAKPEPKIYHLLFDQFNLKPEECFFIDDNADNIAAAKSLGMDGIVFTGEICTVRSNCSV